MKAKYQILQRPLKISEIDFRVRNVNNKWVTIVAYKDARTDMAILNEADVKWQRQHQVINGNLYCSIGIWDEDIQQWVWRSDVGTPNQHEPEKSQSSDSFKRAGTNWGIGMELYNFPKLITQLQDDEDEKRVYPNDWKWYLERDDNGNITRIACKDKHGRKRIDVRPEDHKIDGISKEAEQPAAEQQPDATMTITKEYNDKLDLQLAQDQFIHDIGKCQSLEVLTELIEYKREEHPELEKNEEIKNAIAARTKILLKGDS